MSNLTVFQFETHEVRFVGTPDKLEWIASDVIFVLYPEADKRNHSNYLKKVRNKWKGHKRIMTPGGEQEVTTLLEPGLYYLLGRSNSPLAITFQDWLYEDAVPSIRKTGKYEIPQPARTPEPTPNSLPPSPEEIATAVNLVLSVTDIHQNLKAGAIANAMAHYFPALKPAMENHVKPLLTLPVESKLVRPTVLGEKLTEITGEPWSAVRVNKLLLEQGFQIKNPDGKNPAYLPTEKGKEHGQLVLDTARGRDKTVQSLQWHLSVLEALEVNN